MRDTAGQPAEPLSEMALPIQETPVLTGKEAQTFLEEIEKPKPLLGEDEVRRLQENFQRFKAISVNL